MAYVDITAIPVLTSNKAAYLEHARATALMFKEHGASRVTDTWGDAVPDGKVTDFKKAVALEDGESVVVSWVFWPDKATRDAGWEKVMSDPRIAAARPPFDGKRMIYAGFEVIADS